MPYTLPLHALLLPLSCHVQSAVVQSFSEFYAESAADADFKVRDGSAAAGVEIVS